MVGLASLLILVACGGSEAVEPTETPISSSAQQPTATQTATVTETVEPTATGTPTAEETEPTASPTEEVQPAETPTLANTAPIPVLPVTIVDFEGNEVTVSDVSRIVPLNGDFAEIIYALGLGDNVVATDTSASYPPEAVDTPKIGYQRQLAAEGILAVEPTVLIGNDSAGPPEVLQQIRDAGVPVVILPSVTTIEGVPDKIQAVADALGVSEAGQALAAQTQQEIDEAVALAEQADSQPRVAYLYVRGANTQLIAGSASEAHVMIEAAGGINTGAELGFEDYQPITAEALVEAAPDVYIIQTTGLESIGGIEGLLKIPGIAQTPGGENQAIYDYDALYFLGLGPRTGQALLELVQVLHPELDQ